MKRLLLVVGVAAVSGAAACTEVSTDPNAVVAIHFDGSAYPSIVAGDSLRDSLGTLQPLRATGLNYRGAAVPGAAFVFSSPDTVLRVLASGNVFATRRKADGTPARVFATIGSLQSQPDSLFVVARADSMKPANTVDTIRVAIPGGGSTAANIVAFTLFGDTLAGAPKVLVPMWLVSFRLRYRGVLLSPNDTSVAYTYVLAGSGANTRRVPNFVDSTDAAGQAGRGVFVRSISTSAAEDTIFLVATARRRKLGTTPISAETMIILRP